MPKPILQQTKDGFTLIEVMVSIIIMMIGLLGLLQAVNIAMEHNMKNQQRDEVVKVAETVMNSMRNQVFGAESTSTFKVPSRIRKATAGNPTTDYVVKRGVTVITTDVTNQYRVDVRYKYKNFSTYHSIVSLRGK